MEIDASGPPASQHRPARTINEDDYGEDEDDEDDETSDKESPLKGKGTTAPYVNGIISTPKPPVSKSIATSKPPTSAGEQAKSSEDARKKLEQEKKAAEKACLKRVSEQSSILSRVIETRCLSNKNWTS